MKFSFFFLNLFIYNEVNDGLTNSDWLECRLCYCSAISIFIYLRCSILVTRVVDPLSFFCGSGSSCSQFESSLTKLVTNYQPATHVTSKYEEFSEVEED